MSVRPGLCALIICASLCVGCASYTDAARKVYLATDAGDYGAAINRLNDRLGVAEGEQLPEKWTASRSLAVLERAVLLQATGQYRQSARDLSAAESELELLDMKPDASGTIGKYVYSDSAATYKTPPTERLALNALNMVNYLALDDLEGAAVEARRFTVSRDYLRSLDKAAHGAFGSYLAGFVFEHLREPERALRYYEEALDAGDLQTLREPLLRLTGRADYRGPKLNRHLGETPPPRADPSTERSPTTEANGEIVIVLGLGRVPYKVPKRIPVGAALGMAGANVSGDPQLLAALALKVIVYPELVVRDNLVQNAAVSLDGQNVPTDLLTDLGNEIAREYETLKPQIIGSALTRMIARAAAAEAARRLPRKAEKFSRSLAALATEAALLGLDKPDTRSWTLLPAQIYIGRMRVPAGRHELRIELHEKVQETRTIPVDVPAGGSRLVAVMELR